MRKVFKKESHFRGNRPQDSWQKVSKWYGKVTEGEGHYYHQKIVIPNSLKLLNLKENDSLIDLGCGSGILGRNIDQKVNYLGLDLSENLIKEAKRQDKSRNHSYKVLDVTKDLKQINQSFSHATFILSFQNMEKGENALHEVSCLLKKDGHLLLVLNHPMFRIPRQSSWEIDKTNKLEYRRVNKYMSDLKIPINMNPGKNSSEFTWSYHYPLHKISHFLRKEGFLIETIEEWTSDKESSGKFAKMENRARSEFPLFMAILALKKS